MIVMIVDPSFESLRLAEKVDDMAAHLDVPLYYVLNKINLFSAVRLREGLPDPSRIACEIPQDPTILGAGLDGRALDQSHAAITTLADVLDTARRERV